MKRLITSLLLIFMFSLINVKISFAYTPYSYTINLKDEIYFVHKTISNYDGHGGNQEINFITFDLNNPNTSLSLVKANDITSSKDTLLSQLTNSEYITGKDVIGGVNGEFFIMKNGQPLFTTISNGEIFSITDNEFDSLNRPVFLVDDENNKSFDFLSIEGSLKFKNGIYPTLNINSLNKSDSYNDINLSNYKINDESTFYPLEGLPSRYMLIDLLNSDGSIHPGEKLFGKIVCIGEMDHPIKINKNQILITSYGDKNYDNISYEFLNKDVIIEFNIFSHKEGKNKNNIKTSFTGHEYLIKSGEKMNYDYYKNLAEDSLIKNRHARTCLGITKDNHIILFTVDKSNNSLGMTLDELSDILLSLDVKDAINLDGGGSTSIAFENNNYILNLMNDPNKYQRKITNSISIIKNKA